MTDPARPGAGPRALIPSPDAMDSRVGEETVILHLGNGTYFGLDPVGTVIWEGVKAGQDPEAILARILAAFDVSPEVARADMDRFLTDLLAHDILLPG